jgi:hypothetical protein
MATLSAKLIERIAELRRDIAATEAAGPPVNELVSGALAELDRATAAFRSDPFSIVPPIGLPGFHLPEHSRLELVNQQLLGFAGTFFGAKARTLIEEAARTKAERIGGLRLAAEEKAERLQSLRQELQRTEARLELNRREVEAADNGVLPRIGFDPATWLLPQPELERLAA